MIRGRGHRPYKPSQLLTGHANRAPSVHGKWRLGDRAAAHPGNTHRHRAIAVAIRQISHHELGVTRHCVPSRKERK